MAKASLNLSIDEDIIKQVKAKVDNISLLVEQFLKEYLSSTKNAELEIISLRKQLIESQKRVRVLSNRLNRLKRRTI